MLVNGCRMNRYADFFEVLKGLYKKDPVCQGVGEGEMESECLTGMGYPFWMMKMLCNLIEVVVVAQNSEHING